MVTASDLSVFSPPFISLYTYSPTERDIGNSRTEDEFFHHFGFIIDELPAGDYARGATAVCMWHKFRRCWFRDGYIGLKDFRVGRSGV